MKHLFDKQNKYSLRKLSIGLCSAVIGLSILGGQSAYAAENDTTASTGSATTAASTNTGNQTQPTTPTVVPVDAASTTASTAVAEHPAAHAVDASTDTYWQSEPTANGEQTLTVKLTEVASVDSVTYLPRQVTTQDPASPNPKHHEGLLTKGRLDYSLNGTDWAPVTYTAIEGDSPNRIELNNTAHTFKLGANNESRTIKFEPVTAQYIRLTALESWAGTKPVNSGLVTAAKFIPNAVKPTTGGGTDTGGQAQPTTPAAPALVKELSNQTLATASGNKIVLDDTVKNHLRTADSGTVYIEYRAPENNAILYSLFNASSGTDANKYTVLYSKSGQIGAEIRPGVSVDLNDGTERAKNGEWNAVALTYEKNPANDKNIVKIYVNGVLSTTREISEDVFKGITSLQHAQIGAAQRGSNSPWGLNGLEVRNFKLYNKALPQAEILTHSAQFIREPQTLPTNPGEEVTDKVVVFQGGRNNQRHEGVHAFRIPALLKTLDGTLIAATDQRHSTSGDWGDIATVIKRSTDNGATWGETIKIVDLKNSDTGPASSDPMTIDPGLVQDPTTKRIFAIYDMFSDAANASGMGGAFGLTFDRTPAHSIIDGKTYVNVFKNGETEAYTVRENGIIHTPAGQATNYRVNVNDNSVAYANLGDIYEGDGTTPVGNIYYRYDTTSPFKVMNQMFIWMSYSDDDGLTWSRPKDITTSVKKDYMSFLGVGPGAGIVLKHGPNKGRLVIPAYSANYQPHPSSPLYNGSQSMLFFYSDDCGETWHSGESVNDNRTLADGSVINSDTMSNAREQLTESTVVQLRNGDLKVFLRGLTGKLTMATSKDGGLTFESDVVRFNDVNEVGVQLSAVQFERDGKEYVVLANADGPGRANGHVRVAEVDKDGNLKWINHRQIEEGAFAYNSLQYLGNDEFGLIYESKINGENDYTQRYRKFNWTFLTSPEPKLPDNNVANVSFDDASGTATLTFEKSVLPTNNPSLLLSNGRTLAYASQPDAKKLTYRISAADKGATVLGVLSGDISNVNGLKVNPVVKLVAGDVGGVREAKIDNKVLQITAQNPDAWQPGNGPDKLLDGNRANEAELKWDMASNHVNGVYPAEWRLPQALTLTTQEGLPLDLTALLITKRTNANGTMTKYKVEAYLGDTKVHDSQEVTVAYETVDVVHSFGERPVKADRVVLTILEAKRHANGDPTPTMMTLRELALYGSGTTTRNREVTSHSLYNIVERFDKTLPVGTYRVETPGVHGQVVKKVRETFVNGVLTNTEVLEDNVRNVAPVDEVVVRGPRIIKTKERKETVTLEFSIQRVLDENLLETEPEVVEQEGENGSVVEIYEDSYADCLCEETNLISTRKIGEENRVAARNKVVRYGIKKADPTDPTSPVDPTDPTDPTLPTDSTDPTTPVDPTDPTDPTLPVDPFDPTHPTDPTLPTDSSDPTSPVDPSDSSDPTLPVDPFDPTHPTDPTLPTDSSDPTTPVDPSNPTDPTTPVDPTDSSDPTTPVDPTDSSDPTSPVDPTDSTDPTSPVDPTDSTDPTTPVDPTDSTDPTTPVDPTDSSDPTTPVDPTDSTDPTTPVDPTDASDPTTPVDPTDSTDPTTPVDPTDSSDPTTPVDPTDSSDPTTPVDPTNPVKPTGSSDPVAPTQPAVTPARVLKDEATGVQVTLAAGEDANIVALRIVPKETGHVATPSALKDADYDLFDIELIDKYGQIIKMAGRAEVSLPVDAGKEVAAVVYLPNSDRADNLPFRNGEIIDATGQRQKVVIFTAEHFSEYGIVYKPATVVSTSGTSTDAPVTQPTGQAPAAATPAGSATAAGKPTLPNTGEASSSLVLLGGAALVAALGLTSLRKRED